MASFARVILGLLLAISLFASSAERHVHNGSAPCFLCLFAPSGRRNGDLPLAWSAESNVLKSIDARITVVRDAAAKKQTSVCVVIPFSPRHDLRLEGGNRIHAPPEGHFPEYLAGGYDGRAPPLG